MALTDISHMSTEERLQMMEALWDTLSRETPDCLNSEWHETILAERSQKIKEGKATFISLQTLKSTFKSNAQ